MSPRLRLLIFAVLGSVLAVFVAVDIANESYALAGLTILVITWVLAERFSQVPPDAWPLAFVLVGYIVGNRGFAQFLPIEGIPLLPAEGVLLVAVPALLVRMAFKHAAGIRRDGLNVALLFWIALGAVRLPLDLREFGVTALRDFAMVYYAAFFFIGQAFAGNAAAARVLRQSLTVAFVILPAIVVALQLAPDFFLTYVTWNGVPLIFHKSDIAATMLVAGFFWLWSAWAQRRRVFLLVCAGANLVLLGAMVSPRAAMVALLLVTGAWMAAGYKRMVLAQVIMVVSAALLATIGYVVAKRDLRDTPVYSAYEHAVSIVDFQATGTYRNIESGDPGDNNRFRLVWWQAVTRETFDVNPVFGLGFGYDLATRFLADYNLIEAQDFSARSPHSMLFSVLGRMGCAGLVLWLVVAAYIAGLMRRIFAAGDLPTMGLISVAAVLWISACFGVVLEGPMGAVVFWTTLGLANALQAARAPKESAAPDAAALQPADPAGEVVVNP